MKFIYFVDKNGENKVSVAVNRDLIKYVVDNKFGPTLHFVDSSVITVEGNFLGVVAQLNINE